FSPKELHLHLEYVGAAHQDNDGRSAGLQQEQAAGQVEDPVVLVRVHWNVGHSGAQSEVASRLQRADGLVSLEQARQHRQGAEQRRADQHPGAGLLAEQPRSGGGPADGLVAIIAEAGQSPVAGQLKSGRSLPGQHGQTGQADRQAAAGQRRQAAGAQQADGEKSRLSELEGGLEDGQTGQQHAGDGPIEGLVDEDGKRQSVGKGVEQAQRNAGNVQQVVFFGEGGGASGGIVEVQRVASGVRQCGQDSDQAELGLGCSGLREPSASALMAQNTLLPPKFSGTDGTDVRKWLRIFEEFANDAKWDDATSASKVKLLLTGEAQLVVWDLAETRQKSFKSIKEDLTKFYGGEADSFKAMSDFYARKRGDAETLRELCFNLKLLHQKARPEDSIAQRDRDVRFKLLQLLKADIRDNLLKAEDAETCSLETLLQRAARLEELAGRQSVAAVGAVSATSSAEPSEDRLDRLEKRMEELIARVSVQSGTDTRRRRQQRGGGCFNCGQLGHRAAQCQQEKQPEANGKPCRWLLDTGAQTSLISDVALRELDGRCELKPADVRPVSVDGSVLELLGSVSITVRLSHQLRRQMDVLVVRGIRPNFILGMDFVSKAARSQFSIDQGAKTVAFDGEAVPFSNCDSKQDGPLSCCLVPTVIIARVQGAVVVPPRSVKVVDVTTETKQAHGIFEPSQEFIDRIGVLPGRVFAVSSESGKIPVQVCNLSCSPVTLFSNQSIGTFESAEVIDEDEDVHEWRGPADQFNINPELPEEDSNRLAMLLRAFADVVSVHEFDVAAVQFQIANLPDEQDQDQVLHAVRHAMLQPNFQVPAAVSASVQKLLPCLTLSPDGALLHNGLPVIPQHMRAELLQQAHDRPSAGHLGQRRVLRALRERSWWPDMREDVRDWVVRAHLHTAQKSQHEFYNLGAETTDFKTGDRVMLTHHAMKRGQCKSLSNRWSGPFIVLKKVSPVNYRLQAVNGRRRLLVHHDRLKRFIDRPNLSGRPPAKPATEDDCQSVEDAAGQLAGPDAWEPLRNLDAAEPGNTVRRSGRQRRRPDFYTATC
uniref:CCHC-type domain-containing protein n=1 Tax=Macrostomum lignano TaxID=282301 RepID=A0A1I8I558_9PLAT